MSNLRFKAIEITLSRKRKKLNLPKEKVSTYFGELTFNRYAMREFLTHEAYQIHASDDSVDVMVILALSLGMLFVLQGRN